MPGASKKKKTGPGATASLKPRWKKSPIPKQYVNSVAISADAGTVVAGTYFFPYAAGVKHSPADATLITVGTFAWNAKGKSLWQDKFPATEGVYWVALSRDSTWAASGGRTAPAQGFVYAYDVASGNRVLAYNTAVRVNMVALSGDASYLVAGADETYLFSRSGASWGGPQKLPCAPGDSVVAVAISADGAWIVAGTFKGSVILVPNKLGAFGAPSSCQLGSGSIHWAAISGDGSTFAAAAGDSKVHWFKTASFAAAKAPAWSAPLTGCKGCRSVAVCDDGSLVSAAANAGSGGKVFLFANKGTSGTLLWTQPTKRNPNSTSIDAGGKYVTAADGYPDGTQGDFYLFRADGTPAGSFKTSNMSWPMQISANGSAIAAGSDNASIYYFPVS